MSSSHPFKYVLGDSNYGVCALGFLILPLLLCFRRSWTSSHVLSFYIFQVSHSFSYQFPFFPYPFFYLLIHFFLGNKVFVVPYGYYFSFSSGRAHPESHIDISPFSLMPSCSTYIDFFFFSVHSYTLWWFDCYLTLTLIFEPLLEGVWIHSMILEAPQEALFSCLFFVRVLDPPCSCFGVRKLVFY